MALGAITNERNRWSIVIKLPGCFRFSFPLNCPTHLRLDMCKCGRESCLNSCISIPGRSYCVELCGRRVYLISLQLFLLPPIEQAIKRDQLLHHLSDAMFMATHCSHKTKTVTFNHSPAEIHTYPSRSLRDLLCLVRCCTAALTTSYITCLSAGLSWDYTQP